MPSTTSASSSRAASRTSFSSLFALGVLGLLVSAVACGGSDESDGSSSGSTPGAGETPGGGGPNGEGPKAPPVGKPATSEELTEKLGVFVTTTGADNADGTRQHPLARIQPAIELAKKLGKRVYVCTGTYREELVLADSISVIGALDCSTPEVWRIGAARTRIESATSPAVRAKDIVTATRLEGLDIVAPPAAAPGGSSIGLLAERAGALVVASSRLAAGDAAKGEDGVEGIALTSTVTAAGNVLEARDCTLYGGCLDGINGYRATPGGRGGSNVCAGAPGFTPEAGSTGGTGGLFTVTKQSAGGSTVLLLNVYGSVASNNAGVAEARTGANGTDAADGASGPVLGTVSAEGYVPADGTKGGDGTPGMGGQGGAGEPPNSVPKFEGNIVRGWAGAGGGAGGCPGLAGTPGKGGGASIAALLLESAVTFEDAEVVAGKGGQGGQGTLGSAATAGGSAGINVYTAEHAGLTAQPGGRGGAAGISGNGSNGPSIGIAHKGAAPIVKGGSVKPGAPASGTQARTRTDAASGLVKTIPATQDGIAKDIVPL